MTSLPSSKTSPEAPARVTAFTNQEQEVRETLFGPPERGDKEGYDRSQPSHSASKALRSYGNKGNTSARCTVLPSLGDDMSLAPTYPPVESVRRKAGIPVVESRSQRRPTESQEDR